LFFIVTLQRIKKTENMSLLNSLLENKDLLGAVASQLGTDESKAGGVVSALGSQLFGKVKNNIASQDVDSSGLESLITGGGLSSLLDNAGSFFGSSDVETKGIEALSHITGSKDGSRQLASEVAEKTGFDISKIKGLLPMIAPMVLGAIGKNSSGTSGGGLLSLLDQDGDGDTDLGDIMDMAKKFF
jgi:hypothetical protein